MQKIIIRHRRNYNQKQELTLSEFKEKFSSELQIALQIYKSHLEQNQYLKPPFCSKNANYINDFYFDLRWNFNNNAPTEWYVDKII